MNIAYLLIDGDYEYSARFDQFIYNETNNIMRFNDKIILLKDKVNNKFFDLHYFVAKENYDINDIGNIFYFK